MDGQQPEDGQAPAPAQFAPGDTIRPQQQSAPAERTPIAQQPAPSQAAPQPVEQPIDTEPQQAAPAPQPVAIQPPQIPSPAEYAQAPNPYIDTQTTPDYGPQQPTTDVVSWTASEFIAHHKTGGWYTLLLLAAGVAAVLIWFITKDIVSSIVIIFAGAVLASYAARKPRQLSYQLDPSGLTIDQRHYSYNEFRSFSVVAEGAFSSVVFAPLKRFGVPITIYYDPRDEQQIINAIISRVPHEERKPDPIDRMLSRIRF